MQASSPRLAIYRKRYAESDALSSCATGRYELLIFYFSSVKPSEFAARVVICINRWVFLLIASFFSSPGNIPQAVCGVSGAIQLSRPLLCRRSRLGSLGSPCSQRGTSLHKKQLLIVFSSLSTGRYELLIFSFPSVKPSEFAARDVICINRWGLRLLSLTDFLIFVNRW